MKKTPQRLRSLAPPTRDKIFIWSAVIAGCDVLLSNSDGSFFDPDNRYIDELYRDFIIYRTFAKRSISCAGSKRGPVAELLIRNYRDCQGDFF